MGRPSRVIGCLAVALACSAPAAPAAAPAGAAPAGSATAGRAATGPLPLGAPDLPETRTTTTLQPGVTLTRITRGVPDTTDHWTVEVASPDAGNPDPDAPKVAITDRDEARRTADALTAAGLTPRVEGVRTPRTADYGALLGYRVRIGAFDSSAAASDTAAAVTAAGYAPSTIYTGWDDDAGAPPTRGTWHLDVLTVDPRTFHGRLVGDYGPDLYDRETTSALARAAGATAAVNAGFFVLDPTQGAPGDPAGVGVYGGRLESQATNGRPALVLNDNAAHTAVTRLWFHGHVVGTRGRSLTVAGLNRVPGKIRNCGEPGVQPLARPQQDVTCTSTSELVAFDSAYAPTAPTGVDAEVVLDARGRVLSTDTSGGAAIPTGGRVIEGIGPAGARLMKLAAASDRLRVSGELDTEDGSALHLDRRTTVVNGAPQLVRDGQVDVTPKRDGAVHPGQPSFYYGWGHKRNPRTFAGIDDHGRTVLVTADGRSTASLGLSLSEEGAVAQALGLRNAMNLDGGGSTTAVVDGTVINAPSDATGERPVGDAVEILPG